MAFSINSHAGEGFRSWQLKEQKKKHREKEKKKKQKTRRH